MLVMDKQIGAALFDSVRPNVPVEKHHKILSGVYKTNCILYNDDSS